MPKIWLNCDGSPWCDDCNDNGILDWCDINVGISLDVHPPNGVPDECEEDCNNNGTADSEDLVNCDGSPWCRDCNGNGTLDKCDLMPVFDGLATATSSCDGRWSGIRDDSGHGTTMVPLTLRSQTLMPTNVSVLLNDGSGVFAEAIPYEVGVAPISVASADLNNDGWIDLVTTNKWSFAVSVLLNNGDAMFDEHVLYPTAGKPYSVALEDLDNGHLDRYGRVADYDNNNIVVVPQQRRPAHSVRVVSTLRVARHSRLHQVI